MITERDGLFGIYRGVVENNNDLNEAGRCQIRILGIHPISKDIADGLPTENLPWAEPACPIFGGISQVGIFGVPCQGAHVFLFFESGNRTQPRYFATAPGMPLEPPNGDLGFYDPDEIFPTEPGGQPDWYKSNGFGGTPPEYVDSFAIIDKSGNRIEFDSTDGQEKVIIGVGSGAATIFHKDGSRETHLASGTESVYTGGKVEVNSGDSKSVISGSETKTVGSSNESVMGNKKKMIMGSQDTMIMGILNQVTGGLSYQSKGDSKIMAAGDIDFIGDGNVQVKSNTWDVKIKATAQNIKMQALLGSVDGLSRSVSSMATLNASYGGLILTSVGGGLITDVSSIVLTKISSSTIVMISAPIIMIG